MNQDKQMKRYSVSLVYLSEGTIKVKVLIPKANSKEEALGIAMEEFKEEMKDYYLGGNVVVEIP